MTEKREISNGAEKAKNIEEKKIKGVLDELRQGILAHGGDVSFLSYKNGVLTLRIEGACRGCQYANLTFNLGVEQALKEKIPEIKEIVFE